MLVSFYAQHQPRLLPLQLALSLNLAQLFIDTVPLGAHTVAMDCLAIGTPVVAVAGALYAHRVSSSILAAAGTPGQRRRRCSAR
jgi:predicted O-linked N-acetylglucosamine transferase (SPINDLY family)